MLFVCMYICFISPPSTRHLDAIILSGFRNCAILGPQKEKPDLTIVFLRMLRQAMRPGTRNASNPHVQQVTFRKTIFVMATYQWNSPVLICGLGLEIYRFNFGVHCHLQSESVQPSEQ